MASSSSASPVGPLFAGLFTDVQVALELRILPVEQLPLGLCCGSLLAGGGGGSAMSWSSEFFFALFRAKVSWNPLKVRAYEVTLRCGVRRSGEARYKESQCDNRVQPR
jgi:hypothetical protein